MLPYLRIAIASSVLLFGVLFPFIIDSGNAAGVTPAPHRSNVVVADSRIRARELCSRAVNAHQAGLVYFEESATTFRSSAFAVLAKAISLADACPDSTIVITGHTDSSGYEPSNQRLSVTRANQVADYISNQGISRDQLMVSGVGSSQPVADNATRFGRSLNRRISVEMRQQNSIETD